MVTEHLETDSEGQMELSDDDEEDLCRVWDMAMDKVQDTNNLLLLFSPLSLNDQYSIESLYRKSVTEFMFAIDKYSFQTNI